MGKLGIESPAGKWYYWVEMANAYALCDAKLPGNTVIRMTSNKNEAEEWIKDV